MKKLKLFSLLMLLFVGVTSMWAVDYTLVYTLDGTVTSGGNSNYAQDGGGLTQDGISWSVTGNTTINPWRIGGKSLSGVDREAYSKTAISDDIAKIEIEHGNKTLSAVNSMTVIVASNADFSTVVSSFTPTFEANKTVVINRPDGKDWSNCYYKIVYNVNAGSSNSYIQLKSVKFYAVAAAAKPTITFDQPSDGTLVIKDEGNQEIASGAEATAGDLYTIVATPDATHKLPATITVTKDEDDSDVSGDVLADDILEMPDYSITVAASFTAKTQPTDEQFAWSAASASVEKGGEGNVFPSLTNTLSLDVTYESSETAVATIASDGTITLVAAGETQISAIFAGNGDYLSKTVKYTLTVTVDCENKVAVHKTAPVNGSFNVSAEEVCADGEGGFVIISDITPDAGYELNEVTVTVGTYDANTGKVTGITAETTIEVTFKELPKYTATWFVNGEELKSQNAVAGTALEIPADPTKLSDDCAEMVFKGWVTAPIASPLDEAPEYVTTEGLKMGDADANFYAVFATKEVNESSEEKKASIAVSDYATAHSWGNSTNEGQKVMEINSDVTATINATDANSGKYYNDGWRIYQTGSAKVIISTTAGTLKSSKFTYTISNTGAFFDGETQMTSGTAVDASGTSATYTVGNSGTATNGQVRISAIEIMYEVSKSETTYTGFLTTCPECSKVTLLKADAEHGSFILKQNGVEVSSVKTCDAAEITIEATPNPGCQFKFANISTLSGASISGTTITLAAGTEGELTVSASFAQNDYKVVLEQTGEAEAELTGATEAAHYGDKIDVSAPAVGGFHFIGWDASGVTLTDPTANAQSFSMPANNVTLTAKYAKIMSVAEALALIPDPNDTYNNAVVEAFISSVKNYSDTYKSIEYYLEDLDENGFGTGYSTENYILVYGGKGINGADFSSSDDIKAHAKVKIFGQLKNYGGTKEFSANSVQLSYEEAEYVGLRIYGDATKTEYEAGDAFSTAGLGAMYLYSNGYAQETTPMWNIEPYYIAANTTTVTVKAYNSKEEYSPAVEVPVTVKTHVVNYEDAELGTITMKVLNAEEPFVSGASFVKGTVLVATVTATDEDYRYTNLEITGTPEKVDNLYVTVGEEDLTITPAFAKKPAPGLTWNPVTTEATAYTVGKEASLPELVYPNSVSITYTSSDPLVATINAEGVITPLKAGETVIKAKSAANDTYCKDSVSYTLTVLAPASVEVTGEASKTAYEAGETFSFAGLGAKAIYAEADEYEIPAEEITWAPAPAPVITANTNVAVTATWEGLTSSEVNVGVTVKTHKVIFADYDSENNVYLNVWNGEEQITSGDAFAKGTVLTVEATLVYTVDDVLTSLTANGTSIIESKKFTIDEADVTILATTEQKPIAPISWSNEGADVNVTMGSSYELPTLVNTEGLNILYRSSNEDVAAIDPATGEITLKAAGVTSIAAENQATEEGTYRTTFVQYNLIVAEAPVKFYIAGSMTDWENNMIAVRADSYMLHLEAGAYQMKVVDGDDWKGFADMTAHADNMFVGNDGNIGFVLAQEGDVVVNYVHDGAFTVEGTFVLPQIQIIGTFYGEWTSATEPITLDVVADGKASKTLNLTGGWYDFKVIRAGEWLGKDNAGVDNYLINRGNNFVDGLLYDTESRKAISLQPDKAGDYTFSYTFETGVLTVDFPAWSYQVVGTPGVIPAGWEPTAGVDMTLNDGVYSYKVEDVTLRADMKYEYKIAKEHSWTGSIPATVENASFSVEKNGIYDVTFTLNASTLEYAAIPELKQEIDIDPTAQIGAYFTEEWTTNDMVLATDKKSASFTKSLTAGTYQFNVVLNGSDWRSNGYTYHRDYTGTAGITGNTEANMILSVVTPGDYTFTWTFETNALEITFPDLILENGYYVVGLKSWVVADLTDDDKLNVNPNNIEEFIVNKKLVIGDEFQIVYVYNDAIADDSWRGVDDEYGTWGANNYKVDANHAGNNKTIYFNENHQDEWAGYIYVPSNDDPTGINNTDASVKAVKTMENGVLIIRRGDKTYNGQGQLVK